MKHKSNGEYFKIVLPKKNGEPQVYFKGEKIIGNQEHILCCDAHKKETEIMISPCNKVQMD